MADTVLHNDERGRLKVGGNEVCIDALIEDAPKYRGGSPAGQTLLAISGDRIALDHARRIERTLYQCKEGEDGRGIHWWGASDGNGDNDGNMRTLLEVDYLGARFNVPIVGAGVPNGGGSSDRATYFMTPGRRYWGVIQDDTPGFPRIVMYQGAGPEDPTSRAVSVFEGRRI